MTRRRVGAVHPPPPIVRFWSKVDKSGECWTWIGLCNQYGYGTFSLDGKMQLAHRVAYTWEIGPIPEGLTLDHLCRVRNCVRPSHLEAVTRTENIRRAMVLITHCPSGHPYDQFAHIWINEGGYRCRNCKECNRLYVRDKRAAAALTQEKKPPATHCPNGHERIPENLDREGSCRICGNARSKEWKSRKRAKARALVIAT